MIEFVTPPTETTIEGCCFAVSRLIGKARTKAVELVRAVFERSAGEPVELTPEESWAAALLGGVPIHNTEYKGGELEVTLVPCGVAFDGRKWHIWYR